MHRFVLAMLAAVAVLTSTTSFAADNRNITFVNATGYGIKFIGVNPPGDNDFSDNEISSDLADGQSVYIKFNEADKGCKWQIKIDWAMGGYAAALIREVDLCTIDEIKLLYDRSSGVTSYTAR